MEHKYSHWLKQLEQVQLVLTLHYLGLQQVGLGLVSAGVVPCDQATLFDWLLWLQLELQVTLHLPPLEWKLEKKRGKNEYGAPKNVLYLESHAESQVCFI